MDVLVTSPDAVQEAVAHAIRETLIDLLPELVRTATRKTYLTRDEVKELTGWSDRTLQHLRDTRQIPFVQHGRKILYPTEMVEQFLRDRFIVPRASGQSSRTPAEADHV